MFETTNMLMGSNVPWKYHDIRISMEQKTETTQFQSKHWYRIVVGFFFYPQSHFKWYDIDAVGCRFLVSYSFNT